MNSEQSPLMTPLEQAAAPPTAASQPTSEPVVAQSAAPPPAPEPEPVVPPVPKATAPLVPPESMVLPVPKATAPLVPPEPAVAPQPAVPSALQECADAPRLALVIDDEPANRDFLMRLLEQTKMQVLGASSATEALKIAKETKCITLIAVDNKLPDMDGIELLCQLSAQHPEARMVMATMLDERELMAKAFENGCDVFLVKPHGFMELFRRLMAANDDTLQHLIIDQFGPRPYRG